MSLASLRDVFVTYHRAGREVPALQGVSLDIEQGQRLAIVGGSGSGKTTLAKVLLGIVPPISGEVSFQDRSILATSERHRGWLRASAAMVFQDPNSSLNPRMRIRDIVTEPLRSPVLRNRGDVPQSSTSVAEAALAGVGLATEVLSRFPHELSGGQRQRLAIARALISEPALLVADEPVSALDVLVRAQVLNLLAQQVRDRNLALVLISHDLAVVRHLCDTVVVLEQGVAVEQGTTQQVLEHPKHPYTQALVAAALTL